MNDAGEQDGEEGWSRKYITEGKLGLWEKGWEEEEEGREGVGGEGGLEEGVGGLMG